MKGGNSVVVAGRRIDRRRIRDCVDGGDKERKAKQNYGTLESQVVLNLEEAILLPSTSFR
jgi:hypothetical protein